MVYRRGIPSADEKRIAFDLEKPAVPTPTFRADGTRLQQMSGNLVHSALKFTDRGSVL